MHQEKSGNPAQVALGERQLYMLKFNWTVP
jgi:hypothetical protein